LAPTFSLWDQQAKDQLQAARDKSNHEAGAVFTPAFWVRSYGYEPGDIAAAAPAVAPGSALNPVAAPGKINAAAAAAAAAAAFAASAASAASASSASSALFAQGIAAALQADPPDPTQAEQDALALAAAPAWGGLVDQVGALVQAAPDLATLQRQLTDVYGGLDTAELVKLMGAAFALAELKGMAAVQAEAAAGAG